MTDANFRAMLAVTNDSAAYFDIIKRAIAAEVKGHPRAMVAWQNAAKRGARLEQQAGGDITGFDAVACGALIREQYEEEIADESV